MVSELLAVALAQDARPAPREFHWPSAPMGMLVDIDDKEALWAVLDGD
jgi:hypothetical protein